MFALKDDKFTNMVLKVDDVIDIAHTDKAAQGICKYKIGR
jgi:hypothetical protein